MRMSATPRRRRVEIADLMRRRVLGGVAVGSLHRHDRLPSARELAAEFDVDPRLVLAAYRVLSREGLVEIRKRSGIYVGGAPDVSGGPMMVADGWVVDVLAAGVERGIAAPKLGEWLRRCVATRRLRAAVVAAAGDQLEGLCGELRESYGVDAVPFAPDVLDGPTIPREFAAVDFVVADRTYADALHAKLHPLGKPVIAADLWGDLDEQWQLAGHDEAIYVVIGDPRTEQRLIDAVGVMHAGRLRILVAGRDDVQTIPAGAPTYVTRSGRQRAGSTIIPGRQLPAARAFAADASHAILRLLVSANLEALRGH
jgi:DNA-binding transcriptional regulator YhcF (GntR family)